MQKQCPEVSKNGAERHFLNLPGIIFAFSLPICFFLALFLLFCFIFTLFLLFWRFLRPHAGGACIISALFLLFCPFCCRPAVCFFGAFLALFDFSSSGGPVQGLENLKAGGRSPRALPATRRRLRRRAADRRRHRALRRRLRPSPWARRTRRRQLHLLATLRLAQRR